MNIGIFIILAILGLWAIGAFMGIVGHGLSRTFSQSPSAMDSSDLKVQEQQTIEETDAKQQKLMDDMKQKMDDMNHKY